MNERHDMRFLAAVLSILFITIASSSAYATSVPRPIGGENRIKIINYTPNTVFKFMGHYEYQSIIEFGMDEEIETISMGTPTPWQIVPAGNRIFIKPVENDASTNMTVITDKRMYFFEMHAEEAKSVGDEALNFVVKFVYPEQYSLSTGSVTQIQQTTGPDLTKPELFNFNYSLSGSAKEFEPVQVFDDGEFTYFKFRDINAELPAIFMVNSKGDEGIVNYRVQAGYVIVERVSSRFTLRHGTDVICVFNELGPNASNAPSKKKFLFF